MMKTRFSLSLSLLAVLLAACTPTATTSFQPTATSPSIGLTSEAPTQIVAQTEVSVPTALPVATSRGPNLEATDPTTVSLASGGLQIVEFFRFT
jgi:hypothetical protein